MLQARASKNKGDTVKSAAKVFDTWQEKEAGEVQVSQEKRFANSRRTSQGQIHRWSDIFGSST